MYALIVFSTYRTEAIGLANDMEKSVSGLAPQVISRHGRDESHLEILKNGGHDTLSLEDDVYK